MIANPLFEGGESCGLDAAGAYTAELFGAHETAFFEDLEVLRYGGESDVEGCGEGGDGKGSVAEPVQDRPAGGVAECVKEAVDTNFTVGCRGDLWTDVLTDLGTGHGLGPFPAVGRLLRQLGCEVVEKLAPSGFADLRAVGALEERSLMGADEVGALGCGDELDGDERG